MIKKILVSQPKPASEKSPYYDIEKEYGVECVFRPFFKVEGLSAKEFRQQKINLLDYTAVVFTSRHAVDNYFNLAKEMRITIPEDMKYFCVIETIALYIQKYVQYRKRKVFFGTTGKIDGLIPQMARHKTEKYLVPLSCVHNDDIKNLLDEKKLNHTECVMYRTVSNDFTEEENEGFDYDMMVFLSTTLQVTQHHDTTQVTNVQGVCCRIGSKVGRHHMGVEIFLCTWHYLCQHTTPFQFFNKIFCHRMISIYYIL